MKPKIILLLIAVAFLSLTACQKEEVENSISESYYDAVELQYLANGLEEAEAEELDAFFETAELETRTRCVEVIAEKPKGEFPNTITLTFDNCAGKNGHSRTGQIVIELSGPVFEIGSVKTSTFVDFYIDDVQVTGTKTMTTVSADADGNLTLERSSNIEFIFEGDVKFSRNTNHTLTQVSGAETKIRWDDSWLITGTATIISEDKGEVEISIIDPLLKNFNCPWIVSGIKEVTHNGQTFSIDYGDGDCDRIALITMPDGSIKEILLGRRR